MRLNEEPSLENMDGMDGTPRAILVRPELGPTPCDPRRRSNESLTSQDCEYMEIRLIYR